MIHVMIHVILLYTVADVVVISDISGAWIPVSSHGALSVVLASILRLSGSTPSGDKISNGLAKSTRQVHPAQ